MRQFKNVSEELSKLDDLHFREEHILLQRALEQRAIQVARYGHPGVMRTKTLLRQNYWFPSLDKKLKLSYRTAFHVWPALPKQEKSHRARLSCHQNHGNTSAWTSMDQLIGSRWCCCSLTYTAGSRLCAMLATPQQLLQSELSTLCLLSLGIYIA